jgi:hypothetical protein
MKCDVQKIVKVGGIMAIIMGAISLHAWQCSHCQKEHVDPFCPQTCQDKDGFTPSDYQHVGSLPDGVFVYCTPYGFRSPNGRAICQIREGYFLYELPTSFGFPIYYDGKNNTYNDRGEAYSIAGLTADSNLVFSYTDKTQKLLWFAVCSNQCIPLTQINGCFLYAEPHYQSSSNPNMDVYWDGYEFVDSAGNIYERRRRDIKFNYSIVNRNNRSIG